MYKALYRLFGGFIADVVAAIDQVCYNPMAEEVPRNWVNDNNFVSFVFMYRFYACSYNILFQ